MCRELVELSLPWPLRLVLVVRCLLDDFARDGREACPRSERAYSWSVDGIDVAIGVQRRRIIGIAPLFPLHFPLLVKQFQFPRHRPSRQVKRIQESVVTDGSTSIPKGYRTVRNHRKQIRPIDITGGIGVDPSA